MSSFPNSISTQASQQELNAFANYWMSVCPVCSVFCGEQTACSAEHEALYLQRQREREADEERYWLAEEAAALAIAIVGRNRLKPGFGGRFHTRSLQSLIATRDALLFVQQRQQFERANHSWQPMFFVHGK